jgi:peptide/nickel transport system ATP-binding protein/oligopeptide transport system ATP-binding protein
MPLHSITPDLGPAAALADRVTALHAALVLEHGPLRKNFADPHHPSTRALLGTVPSVVGERAKRLKTIEGQPPIMTAEPSSCPFAPRCPQIFNRCRTENPPRIPVGDGHDVACWWDPASGEPRDVA